MYIKSADLAVHSFDYEVTCHGDHMRQFMPGAANAELNVTFLVKADDLNDVREAMYELFKEDVVLVKKRERKTPQQKAKKVCPYCGGNPGKGRTCKGCGGPNWDK